MEKQKVIYKKISEIKPYKNNVKKHPKDQVERIAESIKQFGFRGAILIDKSNVVITGHGRVLAAKKLGIKEVPCIYVDDLSEKEIMALRLADNKVSESENDYKLLDEELSLLDDIDMEAFGFEFEDDLAEEEIEPEIPFTEILNEENNYIVLKFNNKVDWLNALSVFKIEKVSAYPTKKEW